MSGAYGEGQGVDEGTVLVGRETELATIVGFLDAIAARGRSRVFVGEPGIGKTALLAAAADEARVRGLAVLSARGAESERHLSFAGLHSLLYPVRACLDRLEPVHQEALRGVFGLSQAPVELFLVALAALELLAEAAEQRPLLLLVDDLHWLDAASRDVIEFVARRLDSEPLVLLAASRPHRAVTGQSLDALGPDASRTLLRRRVDLPPDLEDKVLDEAAGNPLALLELPVALRSQGIQGGALPLTARLETAFAARLAELDERPRLLLLLAAVNDGELLAEAVAAAANLTGADVAARDAEQSVRLHLAATDGTTVTFRHPLVRSAVLQTASETERRRAHQSLAQVLTGFPDRYAWHLAAASDGPDEDLAHLLDQAADRALQRGAPSSAATWLERSADLSQTETGRGHRLLRAAEVAFQLGRPRTVHRYMERIQAAMLDPADRGTLAWLQGAFVDGVTSDSELVRQLAASARQALDDGEPEIAADLLSGTATRCWWVEPGRQIRADLLALTDRLAAGGQLRHSDRDPRLLCAWAAAGGLERHGTVVEELAWWASEGDLSDPGTRMLLARAAFVSGEFERCLQFCRPAVDRLRAQGRLGLLTAMLATQTFAAFYLGRWDLTEATVDEVSRLAAETRQPIWEDGAALASAHLAGLRGHAARARELLAPVERVAVTAGNQAMLNSVQLSKGFTELGRENYSDAFLELRRTTDETDHAHHPILQFWGLDYLAEAAVGGGHQAEAREILDRLRPALGRSPGAGAVRAVRFAEALLANDLDAEAAFARAFALSRAALPWYRARLDLAFGSWLRRRRRVTESRAPLRAAHSVFTVLGAGAWAERAARELRSSGVKDRVASVRGASRLSPQEWQIARLAAKGLSNRDIGQQLYLSHRTVGSHLYRIFPKLGITSRGQLHDALPPEQ
ncbi:LuxR family transcriptional regulator [Streptomyces lunalinharesii]|uniref:LuxR family transcriptional regulator n=1 Tax=Streptomyces lunalinharesii TaxID=333384 RepID=A0ABN3SC74_9ACTN